MFLSLTCLEPKTEENVYHRSVVLNEAFDEYDKLLKSAKKIKKGSLSMIKLMFGSKSMILNIWKT